MDWNIFSSLNLSSTSFGIGVAKSFITFDDGDIISFYSILKLGFFLLTIKLDAFDMISEFLSKGVLLETLLLNSDSLSSSLSLMPFIGLYNFYLIGNLT